MTTLSALDSKIADYYAPLILNPIKLGESACFFWFPGSGMTTIVDDIFSSKKILGKYLGKIASNLELKIFWGHLAENRDYDSLLRLHGFSNESDLADYITTEINLGNEVVFIIGRIDDYSTKSKIKILSSFLKAQSINKRRIHILFNSIDKPWFINSIKTHSSFVSLANSIKIMPVISSTLLSDYIVVRSKQYSYDVNQNEISKIASTYGGILQLTKEYVRSHSDVQTLLLKFKLLWNVLPKTYKCCIQDILLNKGIKDLESYSDLLTLGVMNLELFKLHIDVLRIDSDRLLKSKLTESEAELWKYCKANPHRVISRDEVEGILRLGSSNELSAWALDKAVSRFRKKLKEVGIDPEVFKTVKKKGYICTI